MRHLFLRLMTLAFLVICGERAALADSAGKHPDQGYANVGAFLVWADANPVGLPEGLFDHVQRNADT
jgi:hypothetical protein